MANRTVPDSMARLNQASKLKKVGNTKQVKKFHRKLAKRRLSQSKIDREYYGSIPGTVDSNRKKMFSEGSAGLRRLRRLVKKKRTNDREARLAYKKYHSLKRGAKLAKQMASRYQGSADKPQRAEKSRAAYDKLKSSENRSRSRLEPLIAPRDDEDFIDKEKGRTNRRAKDLKRLDMTGRLRRMARRNGGPSDSFTRLKRQHIDDLKASKKMDRVSKYHKLP